MNFGQEQGDGVSIIPMVRYFLPIPLKAGEESITLNSSRGINAETRGVNDVPSPGDLGSGPYTQFIIIYIPCIIAAM